MTVKTQDDALRDELKRLRWWSDRMVALVQPVPMTPERDEQRRNLLAEWRALVHER